MPFEFVLIRNVFINERIELPTVAGKTIRRAVIESGFFEGEEFGLRDARGEIVDDQDVGAFAGRIVNLGLPRGVQL
jgi:hypothetical protein